MSIKYFTIEALPDRLYFRCDRQHAELSTTACATRWRAENASADSVSCCKRCPNGAVHAGETATSLSPFRNSKICSRCHRMSPRLITRWLCASCWNRERERKIGKNAKGTRPVKLEPLDPRFLRVLELPDMTPRIVSRDMTAGPGELIVAALRDISNELVFAFWGESQRQYRQMRLF